MTVCLDLPGPSRRVRVEPLRLPAPAVAPRRQDEPAEREPAERDPARAPAPAPDREPVPA